MELWRAYLAGEATDCAPTAQPLQEVSTYYLRPADGPRTINAGATAAAGTMTVAICCGSWKTRASSPQTIGPSVCCA